MEEKYNNRSVMIQAAAATMAAIYLCVFTCICLTKYFNYCYGDWDLATYNQVFRGFLHGKPYMSLLNLHFPGVHAELTMLLFLPVYALVQSPATLLVIQCVMLAAAAFPLFLIAREKLNEAWGLIFVFIYLMYPAIGSANLNEFHPETLMPFIQFFMFYFFIRNDYRKFLVFMLLCIFAKENMGLMVAMLGFYALIMRMGKKWWLVPMISGFAWFFFCIKFIYPHFGQGKTEFFSYYSHLGNNLGQIAWSTLSHPLQTLKYMLMPHKLEYLFNLFGPLSFLSLLSPLTLMITLPNFLQHLLSARELEASLTYYYPVEALAFIFIPAIFGLRYLMRFHFFGNHARVLYIIIPAVGLSFNMCLGPQVHAIQKLRAAAEKSRDAAWKNRLVALVPANASIVSTFEYLPRLSSITGKLYSFHRVMQARYSTARDIAVPDDVEYALIDFDDRLTFSCFFGMPESQADLSAYFNSHNWALIKAVGNVVLFRKNVPAKTALYESTGTLPVGQSYNYSFDQTIKLVNFEMATNCYAAGDNIQLSFTWQASGKTGKDYGLNISLSGTGNTGYRIIHPLCYRIYPRPAWKDGEIIKEHCWLPVPANLEKGVHKLTLSVFDYSTGRTCPVGSEKTGDNNRTCVDLADIHIEQDK